MTLASGSVSMLPLASELFCLLDWVFGKANEVLSYWHQLVTDTLPRSLLIRVINRAGMRFHDNLVDTVSK